MTKEKLTYTRAMAQLETIVNDVSSGHLDIDLVCDKIKEAQRLIQFCKDKLYKTDLEVNKLLEEEQQDTSAQS